MSAHIANDAPGLASLRSDDPERAAAYQHASSCAPCAQALEEAERLFALLDDAPAPPPPSDAVMRRAWNAVVAEIDATAGPARETATVRDRSSWFWAVFAVAASALFAFLDARGRALGFGVGVECLCIELGTAAATVGVAALVIENRSGLGRAPTFAALAGWSGVVAQLYLHFRCSVAHEAAHLVLFHFGGVVLAAVFGGPLGTRLQRRAT